MRTNNRLLASLALLAAAACVAPAEGAPEETRRSGPPAVPAAHRLSNGLEVYVLEKRAVPLATIEVAVRAGSFVEDETTNGLSHLYEHMFFKGNGALPTQQEYMRRVAELGISFNGTTGTERVNYFITLPSRNLAAGMKFMSDALLTPRFDEEELVKERQVVIGEFDRNEATPTYYLFEALRNGLYGKEALRKNPLGVRPTILSATREIMTGFKERLYIPNNAVLVVAGDVNRADAIALAERWFGEALWKSGPDPHDPPRPPLPRLEATKAFVVTRERAPTVLAAEWNGPDTTRDARATYVADVWGTLCGQRQGRFQRAFVESGISPGVTFAYHTQRDGGEIGFQAQILNDRVIEARDVLLREVEAMASPDYFTDEDLTLAKHSLHVDRAFEGESTAEACHNLTFWWASAGIDYYRAYLPSIDSVTREEIAEFVRDYLVGRPFVLACLLSDAKKAELQLDESKLMPKQERGAGAAEVKAYELANGVRAIVRHDPGARVGSVQLLVRGGSAAITPETQGAEMLAFAAALEGPVGMERDTFRRELEKAGARLSLDANYDFSRAGVAAPAENADAFARAVELFASCLEKPALADKAVEEKRAEMRARLENERTNPDAYLARICNRAFFAGHPYANRPDGSLETVEKLDKATLVRTLAAALRSGRVTLAAVSPLEHARAKALLERAFGWIPKDSSAPPPAPDFAPSKRLEFESRAEIPTTYVLAKAPMPPPGHPDYAATRVLMRVLSEKLWDSIRTRHALSYAPQAGLAQYRANYGVLYVSTTEPARCADLMREEMRKLKEEPLPKEEVAGAVALMTTSELQRIESAANHAAALGVAEVVRGGWQRLYDEPAEIASVTPEAVQAAARRYLTGFVLGVIGKEAPDPAKLETSTP